MYRQRYNIDKKRRNPSRTENIPETDATQSDPANK